MSDPQAPSKEQVAFETWLNGPASEPTISPDNPYRDADWRTQHMYEVWCAAWNARATHEPPAEPIGFVARRKSDGYVCSQFAQPGYRHEIADDFEWVPVWDRPSQPPVPEWRPIETAPNDGRFALVYRPLAETSHDRPVDIKRLLDYNNHCWKSTVPEGQEPYNPTDGACHVTHWMPLPSPPTKESAP